MKHRSSGVLLHLTSLPSPYGIGDLGPGAYRFADFLSDAGQSFWQILPLNPTEPGLLNSPYLSPSAFACNPLLLSPELLVRDGFLEPSDLVWDQTFPAEKVDYLAVTAFKRELLARAYETFKRDGEPPDFVEFCARHREWLDDMALFATLKAKLGTGRWNEWPQELRDRREHALSAATRDLGEEIRREKFIQYLFFRQWRALKTYCNRKSIRLIGDLPIYVHYESVDVWRNPGIFKLDGDKRPYVVSGVPPDYFSETGQLWGHPIYRWEALKENGYAWWTERLSNNLELCDFIRIDHFRGLQAYWEVPAGETTAVNGKWIEGPGREFLRHIAKTFPTLPIIAEDLGLITAAVREIVREFDLPGMKVLLFAFGGDLSTNPYTLHNHVRNCVVYTGTHDNNTARGWFEKEASPEDKRRLYRYIGREIAAEEVSWVLIRLAMMSVANTAIIPMQDILGLGEEGRMNQPAVMQGNWEWRLLPDQLQPAVAEKLREMTSLYGRS